MLSSEMEKAVSRNAEVAPAVSASRRVTSITATLNMGFIFVFS
jgi:hypothetical protein